MLYKNMNHVIHAVEPSFLCLQFLLHLDETLPLLPHKLEFRAEIARTHRNGQLGLVSVFYIPHCIYIDKLATGWEKRIPVNGVSTVGTRNKRLRNSIKTRNSTVLTEFPCTNSRVLQ